MVSVFFVACGFVLLIAGGDSLVKGATQLANRYGLSPLFVGVVIVGFGTSAPELMVSVGAVVKGFPALAAGNVFGSNIANCLLVLGVAALLKPIEIASTYDETANKLIVILVTVAVVVLCWQTLVPRWQGLAMIVVLAVLLWRQYHQDSGQDAGQEAGDDSNAEQNQNEVSSTGKTLMFLAIGLIALPVGAELLVSGATTLARIWGISEGLIGLSIVALGTSLPELVTCTIAVRRGAQSVAYGNIIGSNLFNLLGIFGAAILVGPMRVPHAMVVSDGVLMIVATAVTLLFVSTHSRLGRGEASILLISYVAYMAFRFVLLPDA